MTKRNVSISFMNRKVEMRDYKEQISEAINSAGVGSKRRQDVEVTGFEFSPNCSSAIVSIIFHGNVKSIGYKMRYVSQYLCRKYPKVYRPLFVGNKLFRYEEV